MKPILILLLALTSILAQSQRSVLIDFRKDRVNPAPRISPATERDVLSKVFRRYLTDPKRCSDNIDSGEEFLATARKAGQIVPNIAEVAVGSFTAAGQNETAYLIFVNECNASHADNFGTKRVAIFSGARLVADVDADFRGNFASKTDLNMDGIDELLMTSGFMAQGEFTEMAALVSFQDGRMRVVQDFGTVVSDVCASGRPGSTARAAVLSITNAALGQMPKIRADNYVAGCGKVRRWRPFRGEM
jgi:roadblock/LC7 domain-containing protein